MKQFPILIDFRGTPGPCPSSIPWEAIAPYDAQAQINHGGQSLERLAERGGLSAAEAFLVMHGRKWDYKQDVQQLRIEACAFLDTLVRESTIAKVTRERDMALLQIHAAGPVIGAARLMVKHQEDRHELSSCCHDATPTNAYLLKQALAEWDATQSHVSTCTCLACEAAKKKSCVVPVNDGPCGMLHPCPRHPNPFVACHACGAPKLCSCGHPVVMHRPKCFWVGVCGCEVELSADLVAQAVATDKRPDAPAVDPEDYCQDHGTLKPCRHCLGNKGL